jgi:hypothetical protein
MLTVVFTVVVLWTVFLSFPNVSQHPACMDDAILHGKLLFGIPFLIICLVIVLHVILLQDNIFLTLFLKKCQQFNSYLVPP